MDRSAGTVTVDPDGTGPAAAGNLDLGRDVDGVFAAKPDNIFLVKVSYWLGL